MGEVMVVDEVDVIPDLREVFTRLEAMCKRTEEHCLKNVVISGTGNTGALMLWAQDVATGHAMEAETNG